MKNQLMRSTTVVTLFSLLSRGMGFVRDVVIAQLFGANGAMDAFLIAFKIPNFVRRLFSEGAFAQAFVPALAEYPQNSPHRASFINRMAGMLAVGLFLITIVAELAAPWVITLFAPGYLHNPTQFEFTQQLLHITLPYMMLITLTAFLSAILNAVGRFAVAAFTPVLLNLCLILAAFLLAPYFAQPVVALAWGVFIAGIVQLFFQIPFLWKWHLLPKPCLFFHDYKVNQVLKRMLPALFGVSVAQISMLLDSFFASFLTTGSVTWLYYADRITSLPLGIFGVAVATVILPYLSSQERSNHQENYSNVLDWGVRLVLLIGVPAALALFLIAEPVLIGLLHYGEFTEYDVSMTRQSLMIYAISIPFLMLVKIFVSGFYAKQDVRRPVRFASIALLTNIGLNTLFIFPFAHAGLALGLTLSSILNAGLLFWGLQHYGYFQLQPGWRKFLLQLALANLALVLLLGAGVGKSEQWLQADGLTRVFHLGSLVCGGIIVYFASLYFLGMRFQHFRALKVD